MTTEKPLQTKKMRKRKREKKMKSGFENDFEKFKRLKGNRRQILRVIRYEYWAGQVPLNI